MKIIDNENKNKTVILEDDDVLEITTLKRNKEQLVVKCIDGVLHIDELSFEKIKEKSEEEEAIKAMKDYLKKNGG